ncbi:hypothetical protein DPM19_11055 [Actinomadura craniellae]|uniref:Uncharacterized protein n=1 Tax=Actinomadura craniellae TaxID=2231787 RepID=A0A365HAE2_9ACTN|nr:hypothetical protein [Actinomadura craniellae]RAY15243.1 hypothetical protein DPM19_11055 [Actinomadura craniellae]
MPSSRLLVGQSYSLRASGFLPGESVQFRIFFSSSVIRYRLVHPPPSGQAWPIFSGQPHAGRYRVTAYGVRSGRVARAGFQVGA